MRFLCKISWPVEAGNAAAKEGFKVIPQILEEQKPEAIYFIAEGGRRTAIMIIHMDDVSHYCPVNDSLTGGNRLF